MFTSDRVLGRHIAERRQADPSPLRESEPVPQRRIPRWREWTQQHQAQAAKDMTARVLS